MLIGHGDDKKHIDFWFTRSKVKVSRVTFEKKMCSIQYLEVYLSQSFRISLADWSWRENDLLIVGSLGQGT